MEEDGKQLICPVMSVGAEVYEHCRRDGCAKWVPEAYSCSDVALARATAALHELWSAAIGPFDGKNPALGVYIHK